MILEQIQLISGVLMIAAILLQKSESGVGGAFGSQDSEESGSKRRGAEKIMFIITIILTLVFISSIVYPLIFS